MRIEHFSRIDEEDWKVRISAEADETKFFESIDCYLSVADVYTEVSL